MHSVFTYALTHLPQSQLSCPGADGIRAGRPARVRVGHGAAGVRAVPERSLVDRKTDLVAEQNDASHAVFLDSEYLVRKETWVCGC